MFLNVSETGALCCWARPRRIQFVPHAHYIGTLSEAFDFEAWNPTAVDDNGNPLAFSGQTADITSGLLATAVSGDSSYVTLYVQPVVSITRSGNQLIVSTDTPVPCLRIPYSCRAVFAGGGGQFPIPTKVGDPNFGFVH